MNHYGSLMSKREQTDCGFAAIDDGAPLSIIKSWNRAQAMRCYWGTK
jgi:hypothetical protein